jgi:hypothetical protein
MCRLPVLAGTVVLALTALPVAAVTQPNELTVIFEIDAGYSDAAMEAMKAELAVATGDRFLEIVVVRFRGRCRMDGPPGERRWAGTLAFTHSSDGDLLPFVDVACDRVRDVIHDSVWGRRNDAERLLGRAWARVVAHELYHVLANTTKHGQTGIAQPRLSARELLMENFRFDTGDLDKMRGAEDVLVAGCS